MTFVRLLIAFAASHVHIKNESLHGHLQEEVYKEQPPIFVAQGELGMVCKLK